MNDRDDTAAGVRTVAIVIEPDTMRVLWTNEPDRHSQEGMDDLGSSEPALEEIVPLAASLGLEDAVRAVAEGGTARHLKADLIGTARGTMAAVVSVYRLPAGEVLVLTENTWQVGRRSVDQAAPDRSPRQRRR